MNRTIIQTRSFSGVRPEEVYEALMDSRKHSGFTGAPASIRRNVGGRFSAYDGYIEGRNLLLIPGKKIVQMWRGSDWPDGHYALTSFVLTGTRKGTRLRFRQTGIPEDKVQSIKRGWIEFYWMPLKRYLEKAKRRSTV